MIREIGDLHYDAWSAILFEWDGRIWQICYVGTFLPNAHDLALISLNNTKWWKNEA